jgi:acetyl-CoA decarbonylase/synthase complex subunit gamma
VLDTDGVNVWCAAGKGTFGTDELLNRLGVSGLPVIVSHKNLIVPQLGAPGISAHKVKAMSGFRVVYGPIRASDIPEFLRAGMKATPEMRRQSFNLYERAVVIPVELVGALTHAAILAPLMFLSGGLGAGAFWENAFTNGLWGVYAVLLALLAGAAAGPLLLPWLPGRAFTTKGLFLGWLLAAILLCIRGISLTASGIAVAVAHLTGLPAITAFYLMNFTGSSTFTSLSGVRKEMRWAIPLEIAGATAGILAWLASRVL